MPASTCAAPSSARKPSPAAEKVVKRDLADYTFAPDQAREWLGLSEAEMDALVKQSQRNASYGVSGPLVKASGGYYTMASVFSCRRLLAATAR